MANSSAVKSNKIKELNSKIRVLQATVDSLICEKNILRTIIAQMPGHVYWMDVNGVCLGSNTQQAIDFGFKTNGEMIGKTNDDLFPKEIAGKVTELNDRVMQSRTPFVGEEIASYPSGERYFLTNKIPLLDANDHVVGLLGLSIDITEKKLAENLSIVNHIQEAELVTSNDFCEFIKKAAHDLASPLCVFENILASCTELNTKHAEMLKKIANDIQAIMSMLRSRFHREEEKSYSMKEQDLLVHLQLHEIVQNKRNEYQNKPVSFEYKGKEEVNFATISCDPLSFSRSISNIINNSVEAVKNSDGKIEVVLDGDDKHVKVIIADNGVGMSQRMIDKICNQMKIVTTKKQGGGIGLQQVYFTLKRYNGTLNIESEENRGTKFILTFPRTPLPKYILTELSIKKGSTVLILDDAESVLTEWDSVLSKFKPDIDIKYFQTGRDALDFIDCFPNPENLTFFCDYYLDKQSKNGLTIILESGIKNQSVLVSNAFNNKQLFEGVEESNIKYFPKQFIRSAKINII